LGAAKHHRVSAFETHNHRMSLRSVNQPFVDETLRCRMPAATFADSNFFCTRRKVNDGRCHQRIVKDHVGACQ
jgi:hypothetical protein